MWTSVRPCPEDDNGAERDATIAKFKVEIAKHIAV